jgi:hypothetical protein
MRKPAREEKHCSRIEVASRKSRREKETRPETGYHDGTGKKCFARLIQSPQLNRTVADLLMPWVERLSRCAEQLAPRQEAFQHCLMARNRGLVHAEGVFGGMGSAGRGCGVSTRVSFGEIS